MLAPGETIEYEAADLDGTLRRSDELFAGAKVTMINIWATWCPPCRAEIPELGTMAKAFEEQGCQIIGVCIDAADDATVASSAALLRDAGADYLNLRAAVNVGEVFPTEVVPVTLFVDSNGRILTEPIEGAYPDTYRQTLQEALALVE
jgi:thiol-disulfide isomerase/thioredoxin